jgi:hypothetical protein
VTGALLITAGMLWLTNISASSNYASDLLGPMVLFGLGIGLSIPTMSVVILSGVQPGESGAASGLLQTMQQVGGTLGIAILVTRFDAASQNVALDGLAGATPEVQAHHIMAEALGSTFMVATIFASLALLVALVGITSNALSAQRRTAIADHAPTSSVQPNVPQAPVTAFVSRSRDDDADVRIERVG